MLKSAQMALFDVGSAGFELEPHDTQSTKEGAVIAAQQALSSNPDIILGPIFADDLKAIKPILNNTSTPVLSFTTDWTLAGGNVYVMGFMPFTQVARVVQYAQSKGSDRIAFFAPQTPYCDIVLDTLKKSGANIVINERYAPNQSDISLQVQELVKRNKTEEGLSFDTLFLPVGGEGLKSLASVFELQGVRSGPVHFLGTGLWDDPSINKDPSLYGGLYAAPDPRLRRDFETRYQENYGMAPPRLASLAYDATALAAVLSHTGDRSEASYNTAKLTNPRGFAGIDGIFRFRSDGLVDRGLAVLEVQSGQSKMVDPAPTAFIGSGS
jgi:ABC-type branched-subunit amino acid transport system substrate-binding protein